MNTLEDLVKQVTFISEAYVYGMKFFDNERLKKKRIKITEEHIRTLLDGIRNLVDALYAIADEPDYTLRCKLLEFLLLAYDSLAKGVKFYHYAKSQEVLDEFSGDSFEED